MTHQQAELAMARAMRTMGYVDARASPGGSDGGIDIRSERAVAQVKYHLKPIGRPSLQNLHGARGSDHEKHMLFFAYSGYTSAAREYADSIGMALFTFSIDGSAAAVNFRGQQILLAGNHVEGRSTKLKLLIYRARALSDGSVVYLLLVAAIILGGLAFLFDSQFIWVLFAGVSFIAYGVRRGIGRRR